MSRARTVLGAIIGPRKEVQRGIEAVGYSAKMARSITDTAFDAAYRATYKGQVFGLSTEDVVEMARRAGGVCELTDIPFDMTQHSNSWRSPWRPSIDRIDATKGYTADNVRLVCCAVNFALNQWGDDVLARVAFGYVSKRRHGRGAPHRRSRGVGQKFTAVEVARIRERYWRGEASTTDLGDMYGVESGYIAKIVRGLVWKDPEYGVRALR